MSRTAGQIKDIYSQSKRRFPDTVEGSVRNIRDALCPRVWGRLEGYSINGSLPSFESRTICWT